MSQWSMKTFLWRRSRNLGAWRAGGDRRLRYGLFVAISSLPIADRHLEDQSFINGPMGDAKVSNIVAATISLARTLDLKAIAEGVETAEQLAHLQELGCELSQGNFISEPLAVEAASALLATGN